MTLKNRLNKLEAPVTERWREAWQDYFDAAHPYLETLIDPLLAVCKEGERLGVLETEAESRAALEAFCKRLGLPVWVTSWGWGDIDHDDIDPDAPDLTRWPERIPDPPPEPPGAWELIEPSMQSEDVVQRFCACITLFTLAHARGHREYVVRRR